MTPERPDRCQNCGYSRRHSRQKPGEVLKWVDCCRVWMCDGCRDLRGCVDPSQPPTSEMLSRHTLASAVPVNDGLYPGIPDSVYHGDPHSLSSSGARLLLRKTPAEFMQDRISPPKPKKHYDFGHAAHKMVLSEGAQLAVLDPAVHGLKADGKPADKPSATTKWKQAEARARENGKTVITKEQMDIAQRMAGKVFQNPYAAKLLSDGMPEVSAYHHDDATGVRLRARFDFLPDRKGRLIIVDYKTALSADPAEFEKSVAKFGYDQQAAFYIDAAAEHSFDDPAFVFIVQMKEPPYLVSLVQIEPEWIEYGRKKNRQAIELYSECLATDTWPGHGDQIHTAHMPSWLRRQIEATADVA
ncbi:PD-(D/E)XK nuclease-like domain-containing protein [[Mycobacterium] crassicus]|uniref:PD-(D/E)XK nuclease-like domain-containing protein n=1 Tax=[Mycobacterium] crassicus TaxID=2872309 RepID=A0ABU5XG66_9MYCO|nr:PD-(D/E)XK nuclease-like domain-containing protein [Mycolicibacter sp. MYC098]MEB3021277.1 PD-(D/E)XK nuclease-like domain-containing protein [Mycolicibacter sp. MYC098]